MSMVIGYWLNRCKDIVVRDDADSENCRGSLQEPVPIIRKFIFGCVD